MNINRCLCTSYTVIKQELLQLLYRHFGCIFNTTIQTKEQNLVFVVLTAQVQRILKQDRIEVQTFVFTGPVIDALQTFRGNSKGFSPSNVIMTTRMGGGGKL